MSRFRANPWAVLVVVSLGFFMTLLDLTIVNIAIPNMISKLNASLDDILWVINAYALVLAVLVITAGRLGDLIGPRKMFVAGVTVFTLASAACGFAPGAGWLIAFRAVQGLGAAMLMPQTLAILTHVFPPERRGAAFGIWGAVAGVATIAGPTLGGLLVTAFDWRYIFFVNIPIGAIVLILAFLIVPELKVGREHRIDYLGVALASASLLAICYGITEGQKYNWGTVKGLISIPLILAVGVVLLIAFLVQQWRGQHGEPLVPFQVFKDRNFSVVNWISFVLAIGMMGIFLPLTIYFQSVLGFSALKAGLAMAPASIMAAFVAPFAGRFSDKIGGKYILMAGLSLFAAGMGWLAAIATPGSSWTTFLVPLIVAGIGMGCTFAPLVTTAMRNIQPMMAGAASGVLNTVRQVGQVIGVAAVGALLQNRLAAAIASQATRRAAALPPQYRPGFIAGMSKSVKGGLEAGSSTKIKLPPGVPAHAKSLFEQLGHLVFTHGFVTAMLDTMIMPIALLGIGALSCLAISRRASSGQSQQPAETAAPTAAPNALLAEN